MEPTVAMWLRPSGPLQKARSNACRHERGVGHHTLRAYAQDLRTVGRFTKVHHLTDPLSKDDFLAYRRYLRDELEAKPATIERRLVTLKSYFAWCADRNRSLPSPFAEVRISLRIPRRLPRPIDRETLKAVLHADTGLARHGSLTSPLFLNAVGRRLRSQTFRKRLRVLSNRLDITPHRFRHSAATLQIEEGTNNRLNQTLEFHLQT